MSHFLHRVRYPPDGPILHEIRPIISRNYLSKKGQLGDKWIVREFPKILVKSWAICHFLTTKDWPNFGQNRAIGRKGEERKKERKKGRKKERM